VRKRARTKGEREEEGKLKKDERYSKEERQLRERVRQEKIREEKRKEWQEKGETEEDREKQSGGMLRLKERKEEGEEKLDGKGVQRIREQGRSREKTSCLGKMREEKQDF